MESSEFDTSELIIVQARDEKDVDRRNAQCNITTTNQKEGNISFEDEPNTEGTKVSDERAKPYFKVTEGNNFDTDGECSSVEKGTNNDDSVEQSEDCAEAILDETENTILRSDDQQQATKKIATAEEAEKQPTKSPPLDAKTKETLDGTISCNEELKKEPYNEEEVSGAEKDQKGIPGIPDNFSSLEKEMVEHPRNPAASSAVFEASVSETDSFEKASTAVVPRPEIIAEAEKEMACSEKEDFNMSELSVISNSTIDSNKESRPEIMEGLHEATTGPWESTDTVEEKKSFHEAGSDCNVEGLQDKNIESIAESKGEEICRDNGENIEEATFSSSNESGTLQTAMVKSEQSEDVGFELQPDEKQEAKEKILYEQLSEVSRNTEFTSSDRNSDANTEKKIAGQTTSITEEEKTQEISEFEQKRKEIQNQEEPTESKPKQQAPDSALQESRTDSTDEISSLMESTDKDIVNDVPHLKMYIDDLTAKETGANIPEEISKEPYKLPNQQNDQSALEGSKLTNEAIFSVISQEQNPQQEDQLNKSNDVTIGKANQAQENFDNSDTTELDLSESNIDIQKDSKSCQESRSDETNGAHIVQDIDKNDNQIEEGNNDQVAENQCYLSDIEAQGLCSNMNDAIGMGSTSATLSFDSIELTEGKDANTENNIASAKEIVKPADAIESLDCCTKQDAASESEEKHVDSNNKCAVSTDFLLQENYDKDQAGCNAETEILEAEDSVRKFKDADEVAKEPNYNEEAQCIKEQASENDVLKKEADDNAMNQQVEITKSYPRQQLHDDSSMQLIKVEAHERCQLNEVQESEKLESTRSEESIEINQSQNEIINDSKQVTEAELTTDTQLQDPEDGTLYNSNIDVSAKQDTYTKSDSIEDQNDGETHAQTAFMEIQETGVSKEETRDENTEETQESATYFGKQDQKIDEESASVMTEKEQYHEECDDPSNAKNAVSSDDIKGDDIGEEKWNHPNVFEVLEQDINAKSDSVEVLQDEKTHKQIGFDDTSETKVVNNEQITEHSLKQESAEAMTPTPLIKVEHTILSKDECTNIASENIRDSETQEDEARDEQVDDLETTKMGLNAHKSTGDVTLPNNENSINIWKEDIKAQISSIEMQKEAKTNEQTCSNESYETTMVKKENLISEESGSCNSSNDGQVIAQASAPFREVENPVLSKDAYTRSSSADFQGSEFKEEISTEEQQSGAEDPDIITDNVSSYEEKTAVSQMTEVQKDEKPNEHSDSNVIHETKTASDEDCVAPNSKAVEFCSSKHDEELLENIVTSNNKSTEISNEEYQVSKIDEEVTIGKQQCMSETKNPNKDVMRPPENEVFTNTVEDVHQDTKADSYPMEARDENTCNQIPNIEVVDNKESVNQFSKASDYAEAEIAVTEAETIVQNKEDHTVIPCENEALKLKEEAMFESQQFDPKEQNKMTNGVFSKEDKGIEIEQENEDSAHMIDKNQVIIAELQRSEVQIDCSEVHDTKVVNSEEIDGQSSEESSPCNGIKDQEMVEATTQLLKADDSLPSIHKGTGISRDDFDVSEVQKEPVTQDSNETNATTPCQIEDEEIMPGAQDSATIVEDMIQDFSKSDNFELQKKEKAHEQVESSEILNQCSEDRKQEEIFEPSKSIIGAQNLGPSNDERTMISSEKIQVNKVEQASPFEEQHLDSETKDLNEMETRVFPDKIETVEKVPQSSLTKVKDVQQDTIAGSGDEKSINIIEDIDQDIQPETKDTNFFYGLIEAQKEDELNEQIAYDEIHMTHEINNEEINNECTKESNSYIGKNNQKIPAESSASLEAEIQVTSKDECAESSIDRIQLENIEPAAMKEMLTLELREANNARNDAIDKSINNHAGNDSTEKEEDVHQIGKENPGTEIECKECNVQEAIAREEARNEPEDETNIYDKEIVEGIEMPESRESGEIERSLSSIENEVRKIEVDNNINIIPNQQTVIGTEESEEYANIWKSNLDRSQPAKKSDVHTQTGFDAECLKLENEGPESMNNSLDEEVEENYYSNEGDISSGQNYMNPVCAMVEQGEQGASNEEEISGVQNALAPESGLVKETVDEDKQGIDSGENKLNSEMMTLLKETTCSQEPILERSAVKEVSLTEPQHPGDRKESSPKVDDLSIQLSEPDHVSGEISLTELYEKRSVEDQELDHTKNEEKVPNAGVPSIYCQDVNETTAEETIQEEIWQENEQEDLLQKSSSEHHGQKHGDTRMEDEDKSTSTMKVPREDKSHEFSTSQKTCLTEEKTKHGETNSDFIPNLHSELKQVEDIFTATDELAMTELQGLSSDFQSANSLSESERRPEHVVDKGSCSQEIRNEDVVKLLQKSEQTNDISGQHDSSSKPISGNKIVHRNQIMDDVQGQSESFEQTTKQYVQEGINLENRELILDANQSNEEQKEQKIAICDLVTEEAKNISDDSKNFESEATKESCQEASSAEEIDYKGNSGDTMDNASGKTGGKNANIQDDESSSQNTLLQGDNEALDISSAGETQQTNTEQMFSPTVEEPEILSAKDAKDNTYESKLEDSRDVSASESKANQSTEKELNDAERVVKFPNLTAVQMNAEDIKDTIASCMFQADETEGAHKNLSGKHLEEIYGTTKPIHEMAEKEDETSSEQPVHETHLPELEQRECEVHSSKECSQQVSELLGEEQTDSDETHKEMCHQLKNSCLIAEDKSSDDFGAHETTGNENKSDKKTVLHTDPTLAQQNMSFGKEEMKVKIEELETSTENNNSSLEGGEVVIATRQQLIEHKDSEESSQFQDTKEDDNPHIQSMAAEKEQEVEENHESLPVLSQLQDRFKNVLMEKTGEELAGGDKRKPQDDSREESEKLNKNEACTQKGASVTESETNGFSLLQPSDPVKESLKEATTDNFSAEKNESGEHEHHDDSLETSLSSNIEQEQESLHNQPKHEGETALLKSKYDEEKQDEQEDSDMKVPLVSEAPRDMELKATHKKSLNILSGVGSKVKNSISKVKKAMACTTSQFTPEEVIIKLNKNKNLDKP